MVRVLIIGAHLLKEEKIMAVLPIAKIGNPVLRKIAKPISPDVIRTSAFQQFIDDMFETMYENDGIGLAAPQVSRSEQLVVMGCEGESGFPETVLINPKMFFMVPNRWRCGRAA